MNESILKISNLTVKIDNKLILDDVSFEVPRGKIITIIGPNGSGKTTIVRSILNLIKPTKGSVWIKDDIKLGYMPQKISLNPYLPIRVINFLELDIKNTVTPDLLEKVIKKAAIEHILSLPLQKISGGEMQKVLFAKALLNKPDILILDEPTQGIDVNGQLEFYKLITKLRDEKNISVIIVSHDLHMVMKSTDYVICLNQHICCEGTVKFVNQHKDFHNLFGSRTIETFSVYEHDHDHSHNH